MTIDGRVYVCVHDVVSSGRKLETEEALGAQGQTLLIFILYMDGRERGSFSSLVCPEEKRYKLILKEKQVCRTGMEMDNFQ